MYKILKCGVNHYKDIYEIFRVYLKKLKTVMICDAIVKVTNDKFRKRISITKDKGFILIIIHMALKTWLRQINQ